MEAIFSSKLYKSSTRKAKIIAALSDAMNVELVQQLREYLDEPEEKEESSTTETFEYEDTDTLVDEEEPIDEELNESDFYEDSKPIHVEPNHSNLGNDLDDNKEKSDESDVKLDTEDVVKEDKIIKKEPKTDTDIEVDTSKFHSPRKKEETDKSDESVEESTTYSSSETIQSATALYSDPVEASCHCICDYVDVEAIRGTLNVREDTCGVSRIFIKEKENELWIYYQDKINLNSVMEPVISVLNSTGFTNLEFNRLARTDNAIVFEVSCVFNPIEPIKSDE